MKFVLFTVVSILTSFAAQASTSFVTDVVCVQVHADGTIDRGFEILIQSNSVSSQKRAVILENSTSGLREVGVYQIPDDQPKILSPSVFNPTYLAEYHTTGFLFAMTLEDRAGQKLLGPGYGTILSTGSSPIHFEMTCRVSR